MCVIVTDQNTFIKFPHEIGQRNKINIYGSGWSVNFGYAPKVHNNSDLIEEKSKKKEKSRKSPMSKIEEGDEIEAWLWWRRLL